MQGSFPFQKEEILLFKTSISFIDHLQEFLGAILANCTLIIPPFNQLKDNIFLVVNLSQVYVNSLFALSISCYLAVHFKGCEFFFSFGCQQQ